MKLTEVAGKIAQQPYQEQAQPASDADKLEKVIIILQTRML